ncbi:MAG: lipoyl synthase [candidate division WOR-3 bacterium]|nr:MAG: lipoyl synthase [candidate division WOR-3 bacterium]
MSERSYLRKPEWLKVRVPSGEAFADVLGVLNEYKLATVCQEARCPNMHECWRKKSATIMILGKVCTRACRFCAVETGNPHGRIDREEPRHAAEAIQRLGLKYVVITSVDRDDLADLGSGQYAETIEQITRLNPQTMVEALVPDFAGREALLQKIVDARPLVIGHNIETVKRLTPEVRDRRCGYDLSLNVLKTISRLGDTAHVKSGFMVGLGEDHEEIIATLRDLKDGGVRIVTIGQYLQPTRTHHGVEKYYTPEEFKRLATIGRELGIPHVISGPLVRSSYHAAEVFSLHTLTR